MLDFMAKRKIFYIIALIVIIPGIISFFVQGLNFGIDFTGGSIFQIQFTTEADDAQVREIVSSHVTQTPTIQKSGDNEYLIRTVELSEEESDALITDLTENIGELTLLRNEVIGPVIGSELLKNAIISLAIALALMLVYIAFRFRFNFGIASILALAHDVLITIGIFSILQLEIDSSFVAAILTVIGYSINNTIVVFDRIRENSKQHVKETYTDLINRSINQTLARSINTVLAILFPLVALYFLGGATTKIMVFALIIGNIAGCFSSVCLSGSFLLEMDNSKNKHKLKPETAKAK